MKTLMQANFLFAPSRRLLWTLLVVLLQTASASAQPAWLTEPSLPSVPEDALLLPPPPLPSAEEVPEVEEVPPGYQPMWYAPWTWVPMDGWKNSAELGINGSSGNAESFSFQTGARFQRKTDLNLFDFRISHNRTNAGGVETQNNALANADYERLLGDSPWTFFVKNGLEYDEFRAFDLRYNVNSGLGYSFFREDDLTLVGRFGAGASREIGGPDDAWTPEALLGLDYEHQVTERNKLLARFDYFPAWNDLGDFRLVSELGWEHLIDDDGNLSVRLGATDRYDSTPNGLKPNDINYQAMFLYKF